MSFSRAKRSTNGLSQSSNIPFSNKPEKQNSSVSAGVHKLDRAWCDMENARNRDSASKVRCSYHSPLLTNCSGLKAGELLEISTVFAKQTLG